MSNKEIAYYLSLSPQQINEMLCNCNGMEKALELLEKISHARA